MDADDADVGNKECARFPMRHVAIIQAYACTYLVPWKDTSERKSFVIS